MADLRVKMGSFELPNPIIISSGHLTRTGDDIKRCDKYGAGAILTKSGFLEQEYEKVVKPYERGLFPDARPAFHPTPDGIVAICGLSPITVEAWAKWFKDNIKDIKTPVIASLMAISAEGYVKGAKLLQEAGAEAVEICLACPLPYLMPHPYVGGASYNNAIVEEVCTEVRKAVSIPLGIKMGVNLFDPSPLHIPIKAGLDWLTMTTALPAAPGINLDTVEPLLPSGIFMTGSTAAKYSAFVGLLVLAVQHRNIHLSTAGGLKTWQDIVEFIMYGSNSIQIHTLFMQRGMGLIKGLAGSLSDYMDSKGFGSIDEMKGAILSKLLTYDEVIATYGQTKGKIVAAVDEDKCTGCGACGDVCNWGAIAINDGKAAIAKDKCEGCGICVCSCPQEAIEVQNMGLVKKLARG